MDNSELLNNNQTIASYHWAATGISSYPLTHPIVGQGDFFYKFQHFIHLIDQEDERFAHVFAIIAQWGVGKSRLAYELISQINDTSPGWVVRDPAGSLINAKLFNDDADREQYLGLYIRYSQIANEYHNVDNWFGYGLYKALLPLAKSTFDNSIQASIAKEAYDRLIVKGFEESKLAAALEVDKNYSDETLYEDPYLVTNLCQAAYDYLSQFGIKYILIALDELETAAEAATYGLEDEDIKHLDGRAIKLMGKAIKEEDPRRKLPWLRYVALCSPAIGDELREIQSTARRFEIVELSQNAFADVSDFVDLLKQRGRLSETYPDGLVEAAYAMSGGNFGWFNVIMANVDQILRDRRLRINAGQNKPTSHNQADPPTVAELFDDAVTKSNRISQYILDHNAINELKIDKAYLPAAQKLLYGQLPIPLTQWLPEELNALLTGVNEYDEAIALRYRRVDWDEVDCTKALREGKFTRDLSTWKLNGVDQPLDLKQLLANLSTYAIHESRNSQNNQGKYNLLIPLRRNDFVQLVSLLYPHAAAEDAARALWRNLIGEQDLEESQATHIGPSIAMLGRLNLRYRKQSRNSLIFRDPDFNNAHEKAIKQLEPQSRSDKAIQILTGAMRLLDENWNYNPVSSGLKYVVAITTPSGKNGGLMSCDALKLHPQGRLILAWVNNEEELELLCSQAATQFIQEGRTPILAFTSSRALVDLFAKPSTDVLKNAHQYLLLYQLSDSEEFVLHQIGISTSAFLGFKIDIQGFTTAFYNRILSLSRPLMQEVHKWRRKLHEQGAIAFPLRPSGKLKDDEKELLFKAWRYLLIEQNSPQVIRLDRSSGIDLEKLVAVLSKLGITPKAQKQGYEPKERAWLFDGLDDAAIAVFPPFMKKIIGRLLQEKNWVWTLEVAEKEWFWGYIWEGAKPKDIFIDWMALACELEVAKIDPDVTGGKDKKYSLKTHSELGNLINEAENWLQNDYPKIVQDMELVFGEGKVRDFFAPLNSSYIGSKTRQAKAKIAEAKKSLSALEADEINQYSHATDFENQQNILITAAKHRLSLLQNISSVYLRDEYESLQSDYNIKTLNFEDDSKPLWERIRRAEIFAKQVQDVAEIICDRIDLLKEEMKVEVQEITYFPTSLFTLTLEKIRGILNGALHSSPPQGSTGRQQLTEVDTLGQYLKDLKVAEATEKLSQLGREVGIDLSIQKLTPLGEIDGSIVSGFRRTKQAYEQIKSRFDDVKNRLQKLQTALDNVPGNFDYPQNLPPISKLSNQPSLVEDALLDIQEEKAERLRNDSIYDKPAKLGNFKPLMDVAVELPKEAKNRLDVLLGDITTLENAITRYYKQLLNDTSLQSTEQSVNALLQIQGKPLFNPLTLAELEATGSLKDAIALKEQHREKFLQTAAEILDTTGIYFERWQHIITAINSGSDPQLTADEADKLVNQGFLVRTYRLGGKTL
ncbi:MULTISPECIES: hypothetical protein [Calothrix]|uniref:Uncharacterized protein n=2 Tax=Calothrix TaxID=1186 RepID=A0ABR8AFM4_9CYAN|nr:MULTISPECIES: hypothetical protein [Calothrix]MBD2198564.1 hypothetical protein [Calothrix parietina FACHB-288]MBD2226981.1 hypothetical protein [Calothrix anomala FACHB-343]